MSTLRIHPRTVAATRPARGSRPAAAAFLALWRWAGQLGKRPAKPASRLAAAEANEVRQLALEVRRSDPRFAADLFAAADRHERLHG